MKSNLRLPTCLKSVTIIDGDCIEARLETNADAHPRDLIIEGDMPMADLPAAIQHAYWSDTGEDALDFVALHQADIQQYISNHFAN